MSDAERIVVEQLAGGGPAPATTPGQQDPAQAVADELEATELAVDARHGRGLLLSAEPSSVPADGASEVRVTVTVSDEQGRPSAGEDVRVVSDGGQSITAVRDHGDGTYTAVMIASMTPGMVVVTAAAEPDLAASVTVEQVGETDDRPPSPAGAATIATAGAAAGGGETDEGVVAVVAAGMVGAVNRFLSARRDAIALEVLDQIAREHADAIPPDVQDQLARQEVLFEEAYAVKVRDRLDRDIPRALRIADPDEREAAVQRILDRERRWLDWREDAIESRAASAANNWRVERDSPTGAYWELDETLNNTPDCAAAAGWVWPWQVLRAFRFMPKRHTRCGCELRTVERARSRGVYRRDRVLSVEQATQKVVQILAIEEGLWLAQVTGWDPMLELREASAR